jgi:hypothetical protein
MGRRDMLTDLHVALAQSARHDGFTVGRQQVGSRQAREELAVQRLHGIGTIEPAGTRVAGAPLLDRGLGLDVRHSEALPGRQTLVTGEVLAQRLLDFVRPGVLALDAMGVVRIHAAQQRAQFGRHGLPCELCGGTGEIGRLGEQWLLPRRPGQKRFKLMRCVVHGVVVHGVGDCHLDAHRF